MKTEKHSLPKYVGQMRLKFGDKCTICLHKLRRRVDQRSKRSFFALFDSCDHSFHFKCVNKWLQLENSCPICRSRIKRLAKYSQEGFRLLKQKLDHCDRPCFLTSGSDDGVQPCEDCGHVGDEMSLITCTTCRDRYHFYCVDLAAIPGTLWNCHNCEDNDSDEDDDGMEGEYEATNNINVLLSVGNNQSLSDLRSQQTSIQSSALSSLMAGSRSSTSSSSSNSTFWDSDHLESVSTAAPTQPPNSGSLTPLTSPPSFLSLPSVPPSRVSSASLGRSLILPPSVADLSGGDRISPVISNSSSQRRSRAFQPNLRIFSHSTTTTANGILNAVNAIRTNSTNSSNNASDISIGAPETRRLVATATSFSSSSASSSPLISSSYAPSHSVASETASASSSSNSSFSSLASGDSSFSSQSSVINSAASSQTSAPANSPPSNSSSTRLSEVWSLIPAFISEVHRRRPLSLLRRQDQQDQSERRQVTHVALASRTAFLPDTPDEEDEENEGEGGGDPGSQRPRILPSPSSTVIATPRQSTIHNNSTQRRQNHHNNNRHPSVSPSATSSVSSRRSPRAHLPPPSMSSGVRRSAPAPNGRRSHGRRRNSYNRAPLRIITVRNRR